MTHPHRLRRGHAAVDLDAIGHNVRALRVIAGDAAFMAVVKADGYGHGASQVARAALSAGADWLGVALVSEGVLLRAAGVDVPILVLSEPSAAEMSTAAKHDLDVTVASTGGLAAAGETAAIDPLRVHLKVDTGMSRMGCRPDEATNFRRQLGDTPGVSYVGTFTHLACADDPRADDLTNTQLDRFAAVLAQFADAGLSPGLRHAANSAGLVFHPRARLDLVRCGIATYGLSPSGGLPRPEFDAVGLRPVLSLHSQVTAVRTISPGDGVSYGHRWVATTSTTVATIPLGYADGVPRAWGTHGGSALVGGVARPIRGVVTMDQFMVDCTDGPPVSPGDPVVLLGSQGAETITADDWALAVGTICYEVVCGVSARVPRVYASVSATGDRPSRDEWSK